MEAFCYAQIYRHVSAYVPEQHFFEGKTGYTCKCFYHDMAVLNTLSRFEVLASRGFEIKNGTPFFDLDPLSEEDALRFHSFLQEENACMLLGTGNTSLLFFSDWSRACGLCIVIRVRAAERAVRRALAEALMRSEHPIFEEPTPEPPLVLQLAEIFYYVEHLRTIHTPLPVHCLTLANFAGCKLHRLNLPIKENTLTCDEFRSFSAFLLCLFLTLRHRTGSVEIREPIDGVDTDLPLLRPQAPLGARVEQRGASKNDSEEVSEPITTAELPFLSHPAFRYFRCQKRGETWSFDLVFGQSTSLSANDPSEDFFDIPIHAKRLRFALEITEA